MAFIVGAQRSGTTWMNDLMGAHPQIAAGVESHLFSKYLHHTWHEWWTEAEYVRKHGVHQGLGCYVNYEQFRQLLEDFARGVFMRTLLGKPGAKVVVEKTPDHSKCLHFIRTLFPTASVIHVIRDARAVVASQLAAAGQEWGAGWATGDVEEAATRWVRWVLEVRKDQAANPANHLEVRYERLLEGAGELARAYQFVGLPLNEAQVAQIHALFSFEACATGSAPAVLVQTGARKLESLAGAAPGTKGVALNGFYRKGKTDAWREDLTAEQVANVERIAGPVMTELGYPLTTSPPQG